MTISLEQAVDEIQGVLAEEKASLEITIRETSAGLVYVGDLTDSAGEIASDRSDSLAGLLLKLGDQCQEWFTDF